MRALTKLSPHSADLARLVWSVAPRVLSTWTNNPGQHQTPIVNELWRRRKELSANANVLREGEIELEDGAIIAKRSSYSHTSAEYRFSENESLKEKYANPWGHIRVGRMLEDLDALAGTIAFAHCSSPTDRLCERIHIVTASVDRVKYLHRADLRNNVTLSGKVGWVGNSSLEIDMEATSSWTTDPWLKATFTFVARDRVSGKAARVNRLVCETDEDQARFDASEERAAARKRSRIISVSGSSGIGEQEEENAKKKAAMIDELMQKSAVLFSMPALADPKYISLEQTRLQNALMAQPQQTNTAGRIFGGFLMRRAFELSFATAYSFGGRRPHFHELDHVSFLYPVSIGDLLTFDASVLYTSHDMDADADRGDALRATIHVECVAHVCSPERAKSVKSNVFNFTFGMLDSDTGKSVLGGTNEADSLRIVVPATVEEATRIVEREILDRRRVTDDLIAKKR